MYNKLKILLASELYKCKGIYHQHKQYRYLCSMHVITLLCLDYSPSENNLVVAARCRAPLAASNRPLIFAVAGSFGCGSRTNWIERRYQIRRTISDVMDARNRRLMNVHRMWILETRVSRTEKVDQHQVVLHEHRYGVRLLDV